MNETGPLISNISDTSKWVAMYRAYESERSDAHFIDPFARKLAGSKGVEIINSVEFMKGLTWSYTARTWLYDQIIIDHINLGFDSVVNLAAGLDTRPYRQTLPPTLQWFEIDLPEILSYKEDILKTGTPRCKLKRIPLDLMNNEDRNKLFKTISGEVKRALILSEGLLVYLTTDEVGTLADDIASQENFKRWAIDIMSPGLLKMMQKNLMGVLDEANIPLKFAPSEGSKYFTKYHWNPIRIYSIIKAARKLNRLTPLLYLLSLLPESNGNQGSRPWSAVCLLTNTG